MTSTAKQPLRVLLLEDRDLDEALLRRNLKQAFDVTIERVDSAVGLRGALASSSEWDIVISDYTMPSFTALDALQIVREDGRDLPFIIVSGTMPDDKAVRAMREGARDYVMKDNLSRLKPAIERELEEAARRRALRLAEAERDRLVARERELREAAETAGRLKDEFLAVLSHELRTPLTCILGWARMLHHEPLPLNIVHGIEAIERSGRALARLIEDLLDLSAILSGRLELQPRALNLSELVRNAAEVVAPAAAERELTIHSEIADSCHVWGDPDRLNQIVVNLLTNSVKFTPKGGQIWISLQCSVSEVVFVVRDNGVGIPAEFLPHVFDRFRQADGSVSRAFGGLGLGLSIARDLVEMHGGRVWAESKGAGQGAMFTLHLPALGAARTDEPVLNGPNRAALHGRTALLVDDNPIERERIRITLEQFGTSVVIADGAAAAARALQWACADLLIANLDTRLQNPFELIANIRRLRGGDIPALAVGAGANAADRQRALAAGFNAYVARPITVQNIVAAVLDVLHDLTSK